MNKSVLQIASDIVEACPYTAKMMTAHKLLLAGMISEELSRQRLAGYEAARTNPPNSREYARNA